MRPWKTPSGRMVRPPTDMNLHSAGKRTAEQRGRLATNTNKSGRASSIKTDSRSPIWTFEGVHNTKYDLGRRVRATFECGKSGRRSNGRSQTATRVWSLYWAPKGRIFYFTSAADWIEGHTYHSHNVGKMVHGNQPVRLFRKHEEASAPQYREKT